MKATAIIEPTHNPFDQAYWASGLRENFTSRSYGEGLAMDRRAPRQSLTRQRDYQELKSELGLHHYEGRNWRGFHHHASLCIAVYGKNPDLQPFIRGGKP